MAGAIILIGIPGSGKSTLARTIMQRSSHSALMISPDFIRSKLYGSAEIQGEWEQIWDRVEQEFTTAANSQQFVIYDATNSQPKYRQEVITLARTSGFNSIVGIWLDVPLWICLDRNQRRGRKVPEAVVIEMYNCLKNSPPHLNEGFDRLLYKQESAISNEWLD